VLTELFTMLKRAGASQVITYAAADDLVGMLA
jgi:delta-aminolevulinic acid dehydratase/porphobilinogen synthase